MLKMDSFMKKNIHATYLSYTNLLLCLHKRILNTSVTFHHQPLQSSLPHRLSLYIAVLSPNGMGYQQCQPKPMKSK